jgi:hypothetical protein
MTERTPFSRMFANVIGGPGFDRMDASQLRPLGTTTPLGGTGRSQAKRE